MSPTRSGSQRAPITISAVRRASTGSTRPTWRTRFGSEEEWAASLARRRYPSELRACRRQAHERALFTNRAVDNQATLVGGLTWAFSSQVVRFFGTSKKLRLLFRYPRSEPYFMTWLVPHQIKLTSGRHSKQLHQYPAFGGWGSGGRDHSFTRLFKPVLCSVPIAWIRQDRLGPGDWGIVLEGLRSDGLHRGALDDDAAD